VVVRVTRVLAAMAGLYELPTTGGPTSPRFRRYVELGRQRLPVSGYNPMTSKEVLVTIQALLASDAEDLVEQTANLWAPQLGFVDDAELVVTVATPGMWTDQLATEIEHRLIGRTWRQVLFWAGEPVSAPSVVARATEQIVRAGWTVVHGPPATLAHAAGQEGLATALGRSADIPRLGNPDPAVRAALDAFGDDTSLSTMVAVLFGDDAARALGWTPLGFETDAGLQYSSAAASRALRVTPAGELLRASWSPRTSER
jgi:hypothetical protein